MRSLAVPVAVVTLVRPNKPTLTQIFDGKTLIAVPRKEASCSLVITEY